MAMSKNRAEILGNVGDEPQIRTFQNGGKVANLSVATSRRWKNRRTGEVEERTEWHRVSVTADHLVEVVRSWVRKGDRIMIEGRLETRKWQDQNGVDRYTTEIVVAPFEGDLIALGRAERREGDSGGTGSGYGGGNGGGARGDGAPPAGGDIDDEIPF
ncbi:single-stranded DNA-binding protein [Tropicimonas sp. IMCC34043]|uniref:single-stranded DNA-binding protein n=1 Tax=Tropicimonas sp. IMCC34043 TaxID=2248760 RepID=UPI000E25C33C|nr:single-stranded DNA-binding protein [Tropicimonas sp. IMCC34043]